MNLFEKRKLLTPEEEEKQRLDRLSTTKPCKEILAIWYDYTTWKGFAKHLAKKDIKIDNHRPTEKDLGRVFYEEGLPTCMPDDEKLRKWVKAWHHL